jgi:hypothetical protein
MIAKLKFVRFNFKTFFGKKRDAFPTDSLDEQLSSSVVTVLKENTNDSSSYSKVLKNSL